MDIGSLDREAILLANAVNRAPNGAVSAEWTEVARLYVSKMSKAGASRVLAGREITQKEVMFKSWWRAEVKENMRLQVEGVVYDIDWTDEIGRREGMFILGKVRAD